MKRHTSGIPVLLLPVSQRTANHIREIIILQCSQSKKSLQQLWETRRSRVIEDIINEDDGPLKCGYTLPWTIFLDWVIVLGEIDLSVGDGLEKSQLVIVEGKKRRCNTNHWKLLLPILDLGTGSSYVPHEHRHKILRNISMEYCWGGRRFLRARRGGH